MEFILAIVLLLHMKTQCMHYMCDRSKSKRPSDMSAFVHAEESVILHETTFFYQHVGVGIFDLFFSLVELIRLVTAQNFAHF
jgi:hypothetical protein